MIGFFVILMALVLWILLEIFVGVDGKIFFDFGLVVIFLLGAIVVIFVGIGLINKEIDKCMVLVFIFKFFSCSEFIIGKYLGLLGVLIVMLVIMISIYLVMLAWVKIFFFFIVIFIF